MINMTINMDEDAIKEAIVHYLDTTQDFTIEAADVTFEEVEDPPLLIRAVIMREIK